MPWTRTGILLLVCAALAVASAGPSGQERYRRDWSDYPGMPRNVWDVTHDDRGFLWLVGEEGVHRFDGQQVVPWGEWPGGMLTGVNRGPNAQMITWTEKGLLFDITEDGIERIDAFPFEWVRGADYDGTNALWVADDTGVHRRDADGTWRRIEDPNLAGQRPSRVRGTPDGGAYVGTFAGRLVHLRPGESSEILFDEPSGRITRMAVKDEDTMAFAQRFGHRNGIYVVEHGKVRAAYVDPVETGYRWTGLAFREDTLWVASTREIHVIRADGSPVETLGPSEGFEPGGEVIVDHEKSLWLTSFRGVYQFTEPDVILWKGTDGTRAIHTATGEVVLGRWDGAQRLRADASWEFLRAENHRTFDWGGVSPWNTHWFVGVKNNDAPREQRRSALIEFHDSGWTSWLEDEWGVFAGSYAADEQGVFWVTFFNSLWRIDRKGAKPREVAPLMLDKEIMRGLRVRGRDVAALCGIGNLYCEGRLNEERTALEGDWDCDEIEGVRELSDVMWIDGEPWIGTWGRGVIRRTDDGGWETVIDASLVGTDTIRGLEPSPRGGIWVTTFLERARVELLEDGPRVVERLGPWIGVPAWMYFDTFEQPDGSIWLAAFSSAVQIPAHARQRPADPPRVFVTGFRADGRDLSPDEPQELPATTRRIELGWAAPAFRDPASLRFEVRVDAEGAWVPTVERSFRFVDLGPGEYRVEVRASLDGQTWSESPADIRFAIRSPLWQRPVFWAGMLALTAIGALAWQVLRGREQVRLERQRTDIAMNLHDELGAGLGSIGLLTDLAADESMDPAEGREVAVRVGEISRGLSRSLSDIVWTLRPQSVDLPGFALYLRQRAADLLSAGDTNIEFDFADPVPPVRVELAVRRQIHAIASEALYNAAKHADASRVRVTLQPAGPAWTLAIEDDGAGFDEGGEPTGLGLESMTRRARSIGAELSIGVGESGGVRVELAFTPRAGERG